MDILGVLVAVIVFAVIIGIFAWMFIWVGRAEKRDQERLERGMPATARVIHVGHSHNSTSKGGSVTVILTLEVTPTTGTPYQTAVEWAVEPAYMPQIQAEQKLNVKIDVDDPKMIYPLESWAIFIDTVTPEDAV